MTAEKGMATLAKLKSGSATDELEWITPVTVDRKNAQGLTEPVMNQAFKIDVSKLPAYAGYMDGNKAYTIVQVSRVDSTINADVKQTANDEFQAAVAAEYMSAYGKSLKAKGNVVVNRKLLETKLDN